MSQGVGQTATGNETGENQQPAKRQVSADAFRALTMKLKGIEPPVASPPVAQTVARQVPPVCEPAPIAPIPDTVSQPQEVPVAPQLAPEMAPEIPVLVAPPSAIAVVPDDVVTAAVANIDLPDEIPTDLTAFEPVGVGETHGSASAVTPPVETAELSLPDTPDQALPEPEAQAEPVVQADASPSLIQTEPVFEPVPEPARENPAVSTTSIVVDENANKEFEQQLQALKKQSQDRLNINIQTEQPSDEKIRHDAVENAKELDKDQIEQVARPEEKPATIEPMVDPLVRAMQLLKSTDAPTQDPARHNTILPDMPVLDDLGQLTQSFESNHPVSAAAVHDHSDQPAADTSLAADLSVSQTPAEPVQKGEREMQPVSPPEPEKIPETEPVAAVPLQEETPDEQIDQASQPQAALQNESEPQPDKTVPAEPVPQVEPATTIASPLIPEPALVMRDSDVTAAPHEPQSAPVEPPESTVETDPKSGETARALLDMMSMPSGASQPHERSLAADTLLQLVPKMPERDLVALSERVCLMEDPPSLLVKKLINHPSAKVAQPLLEGAKGIDEQELLRLVASCNTERLLMIAKRRQISSSVCDGLIVRGEAAVNLTLARNPGAKFSHDAFVTLCEIAKTQATLQAPLATRGDTPAPIAFELFWSLPAELRRYVLSRFLTDSSTLDKILKIAKNVDVSDDSQTGDIKFPSKRKVDSLVDLLVEGDSDQSSARMAEMADISQENARRIVADPDGEPLTVAFKTIGLSRNQFEEALKRCVASPKMTLRQDRPISELQNLFDSLSFNKARTLITYWDWAVEKSGPYARRAG